MRRPKMQRGMPSARRRQTPVASVGSVFPMTDTAPSDDGHGAARQRHVPMALITWAFVVLVLLIACVLVVLKLTRGATAVPPPALSLAPASVVRSIASLPPAVFDTVGAPRGSGDAPQVLSGQPLLSAGGLPDVVFVGAEFSPYSAASRWALVTALARFGTFSGLGATSSSTAEVFPRTATFTFDGASFHSTLVSLSADEAYGESLSTHGAPGFPMLHAPDAAVAALVTRYGGGGPSSPTLPFIDVGNRVLFVGSGIGFSPGLLQGMSMVQVAAALGDPTSAVARSVIGAANELSAAICASDGERPAPVCAGPGVRAGALRIGLG